MMTYCSLTEHPIMISNHIPWPIRFSWLPYFSVDNSSIVNRWPCPLLGWSGTTKQHHIVNLETCDLWDIWSEWWGNMTFFSICSQLDSICNSCVFLCVTKHTSGSSDDGEEGCRWLMEWNEDILPHWGILNEDTSQHLIKSYHSSFMILLTQARPGWWNPNMFHI